MTNYQRVTDALKSGAEPAMLCATCPWDRNCISPPSITSDEIERRVAEAQEKDQRAEMAGKGSGLPVGMLVTTMLFAGKDTMASICPVFVLRLRSSQGRVVADTLKATMQGWDDNR